MHSIFFIQYDSNTYNLTQITHKNMFDNINWTPVAISYAYQQYSVNNYKNIKYDPVNKVLQYPDNIVNDIYLNNNNKGITSTLTNNTKSINFLERKIAWNHVMSIFHLPDDLAFLNNNYNIPMTSGSLTIANFTKTGIYVVPAYANLSATDGPQNIDFNNGYTFKIYPISNDDFSVKFLNSKGVWINVFNIKNKMLHGWNKIMSF